MLISAGQDVPTIIEIPAQPALISTTELQIVHVERAPDLLIIAHGVQGPPGIAGPPGSAGAQTLSYVAGVALGGHRIVFIDANQFAQYATNDDASHARKVIGMTVGAVSAGQLASIQAGGEISEPSWSWTPEMPIYLATTGLMTQIPPAKPLAAFSMVVAVAITATKIFLGQREPVILY